MQKVRKIQNKVGFLTLIYLLLWITIAMGGIPKYAIATPIIIILHLLVTLYSLVLGVLFEKREREITKEAVDLIEDPFITSREIESIYRDKVTKRKWATTVFLTNVVLFSGVISSIFSISSPGIAINLLPITSVISFFIGTKLIDKSIVKKFLQKIRIPL